MLIENLSIAAGAGLLVTLGLMVFVWLTSLVLRDASLVDRYWGFGFVVLAWFWWATGPRELLSLIPVVLVSVWGLRLSLYLTWRNWGHGEDYRYKAMRDKHGRRFWLVSLFTVFLLQGAIMWVVAFPLLLIGHGSLLGGPWVAALVAGIALWGVGLVFEAMGDAQLARFKADPANKGRVMDRGLWRYTRHPNYFGDICIWWGYWLMSLPAGGWWTAFGPALMSFFIARVSGVTMLEDSLKNKKPEYADYIRRTNALIPGPPKSPGREGEE